MAAISSLQIGGVTYDIYAKSAAQAPVSSHELSSHSHFSTYFNGTSANSALTSKSALSAGSATKAVSASGANSATFALSSNTARNGNFFEDSLGGVPATFNSASTYTAGAQVYTGGYIYSAKAATTAGVWSAASGQFARLPQVNWTITDTNITGLYKGLQLWVRIPSYGGSSGSNATMLNINGSGAKQIRYNNGNYTTHYVPGTYIPMTYDGNYFQIGDRTDGNNVVGQYSATDNNNYPIILKRTTGGQETQTVKYASAFTYNPSTSSLKTSNISSNNITATTFSGNLSGNATSAKNAGTATYATSAGSAPFIAHDHAYKLSGNGTALYLSAGVNLKPNGNIAISTAANTINISAKDTTYNTLNSINTAQYAALTAVSGLTVVKNYGTISAAKGTTSKGSFTPANSASTFTFLAGNNIDFVSGANTLTISAVTPATPGNGTIKITTGASPATGQFTVNQSTASTITLGSMALAQTSSYMATGSMVPYTSAEVIAGITW